MNKPTRKYPLKVEQGKAGIPRYDLADHLLLLLNRFAAIDSQPLPELLPATETFGPEDKP